MLEFLETLAPVDWVYRQVMSDPLSVLMWSALCFALGYGIGHSIAWGTIYKRRVLARLTDRERLCLAEVSKVERAGESFGTGDGYLRSSLESLAGMGIVNFIGQDEVGGKTVYRYTVAPMWRKFVAKFVA